MKPRSRVRFDSLAKQQGVPPAELERQFFATVRPTFLLRRFETPEEVAAVVAFVAGTTATTAVGQEHRNSDMLPRSVLI